MQICNCAAIYAHNLHWLPAAVAGHVPTQHSRNNNTQKKEGATTTMRVFTVQAPKTFLVSSVVPVCTFPAFVLFARIIWLPFVYLHFSG